MGTPDMVFDEDMAVVFRSSNNDAEWEAQIVHGILTSAGIDSAVVGNSVLPVLEFQVRVPQHELDEAQRVINAAKIEGSIEESTDSLS